MKVKFENNVHILTWWTKYVINEGVLQIITF